LMDAQSSVADSAPLIALVQSLAPLVLEGEPPNGATAAEILAENRFLAARDGLQARLIDPVKRELVPIRTIVDALLERCRPCATMLGCPAELDQIRRLAAANGADRQRAQAREAGLADLVTTLAQRFTTPGLRTAAKGPAKRTQDR
jgi:glutamate---cysteine ligase / carboxylate-amine ligase